MTHKRPNSTQIDMSRLFNECSSLTYVKVDGCSADTKSKLKEALSDAGYTFSAQELGDDAPFGAGTYLVKQ